MNETKCSLACGDVAIQTWGKEDAPVILCLHGWLDNMASFYPLAEILSKHFRVLLVDLPGHGESDSLPEGGHYYIWQNVETVFELIKSLKLVDVTLLGHSMGGVVASLFAGTFPDLVSKLILIDSLGPMVDSAENSPKQLAKAIMDAQRQGSKLRVFPNVDQAVTARKTTSPLMTDEALSPIVERNLKSVDDGFSWGTDSRLRSQSKVRMTEEQVKAFFNHILAPVKVIIAKQGILPKPWVEKRLGYISNVEVSMVAGHHHLHVEADGAGECAELIYNFMLD